MNNTSWYFLGVIIGLLMGYSLFGQTGSKTTEKLPIPHVTQLGNDLPVNYMDTYWGLVDGCELTIAGKNGIISVDDMCAALLEEMKD